MLGEARKRFKKIPNLQKISVWFIEADAMSELVQRYGANLLDTIVDSFSFCVMGMQGGKACLEQLRETVKLKMENGQILLLENMRSLNLLFAIYQDVTAETVVSAGGKGCIYNQDVKKMIQDASGIVIEDEKSFFDVLRSSCGFVISNWYNPSVDMPYLNLVGNICNFELSLILIDV